MSNRLVERLMYAAECMERHAGKFPVPEHIPASVEAIRGAAQMLEVAHAMDGALREARLQLEYLDKRQVSGTTPAVLVRITAALDAYRSAILEPKP